MQEWLKENLKEVWEKEVWPPSSPNYSLLNYFGQCKASQQNQQNRGPQPKDEGGDGVLR